MIASLTDPVEEIMFKKEPQPKASANIKSSERRKLFSTICNTYNLNQESYSKEQELDILPATTKQASFKSLQGYSGTIYFDSNETPLWFKSRDSQLFPSVFTLWKCPFILPIVKTHPHVIKILSNGADLMLPGTIPPFDKRCSKGVVVAIVESEHPTVVKAIGRCKLDLTQFDSVIGRKGMAVEVVHCIHDELFKLNTLVDIPIPTEVAGITATEVKEEEKEEEKIDEAFANNAESKEDEESNFVASKEDTRQKFENIDDVAEVLDQLSVENVDKFFVRSVLQSIQLDSLDLPISSSSFMANHVYKNLPIIDSSYCNIKKTSWKKSSKFLKAMEKAGYLKTKGKDEDLSIVELAPKTNPSILSFVPHRPMSSLSKGVQNPNKPVGNKKDKSNELSIIYLYKPTSKSRSFFSKVEAPFSSLYTSNELKKLFDKYVKLQNLVNVNDKRKIVLDDTMNSISNLEMGSHPREKVFTRFLSNFSPHYKILKPNEQIDDDDIELNRGEPPKVNVITEMRIGRKVITRVLNFEKFYIKPHTLSDELKVKCSGSSTIGSCTHNPKLTEVTVQGPHGKLIVDLLNGKGIPISFIEFEDKIKKKKKKTG